MNSLDILYEDIKKRSTHLILNFPESMVYHDIKFAKRLEKYIDKITSHVEVSKEDTQLGKISSWILAASYKDVKHKIDKNGKYSDTLHEESNKLMRELLMEKEITQAQKQKIELGFQELDLSSKPKSFLGMLLVDILTSDIVMGDGQKRLKKFYEELLLKDLSISKRKWTDIAIKIVENFEYHLPYCRDEFQPVFDKLVLSLQKEKKTFSKTDDLALKKELSISDQELKELKKNLASVKGRDARGIQTVFRTMSKNHYTLNEMVDKKASIMITVNSIILSLVLGGIFKENMEEQQNFIAQTLPIIILTIGSVGSIIFAILSTRPDSTHGHFTEDQIRNKEGNLLFYGNFHDMREKDYQWAFLQMVNDQEYMYESMVRDMYYLGRILKKKYFHIRISLNIFIVGIVLSVLSKLLSDCIGMWIW